MKKYFTLILIVVFIEISFSQVVLKSDYQINEFVSIPQESVFVHFNSSLLFTGEYFYYSIFCFNNKTKQLSEISKVAYVELIGKNNEIIFKHKIKLNNGIGYSDFFIPVSVSSGNYKLVAYTNWMRNSNIKAFFITDINFINPYKTNKATYLQSSLDTEFVRSDKDSLLVYSTIKPNESMLNIVLNGKHFKQREKVTISFNSLKGDMMFNGDYSISVRRKGTITKPLEPNTVNFLKNISNLGIHAPSIGSEVFLPELRGELLVGRVTSKNNVESVNNLKVSASIPNENNLFKILQTNEKGEFYLNISEYYSSDKIYFEVLDNQTNQFNIQLITNDSINTQNLEFNEFKIKPEWKQEIIEQSIHNQIESAYFEFRPDFLLPMKVRDLFENRIADTFKLDDYSRFPTLKETIFEIVKNVSINKVGEDTFVFELQGFNFGTNSAIKPLIFVDGIAVQNHTSLLELDPYNISEILVYRDQFVFGLEVFQGAIVIKTIKGLNDILLLKSSIKTTTFFKSQANKKYFSQEYNGESVDNRLPDDRQQLLWVPNFELTKANKELSFYTSDVAGEFEISLEGFTKEGIPISLTKSFMVKD